MPVMFSGQKPISSDSVKYSFLGITVASPCNVCYLYSLELCHNYQVLNQVSLLVSLLYVAKMSVMTLRCRTSQSILY